MSFCSLMMFSPQTPEWMVCSRLSRKIVQNRKIVKIHCAKRQNCEYVRQDNKIGKSQGGIWKEKQNYKKVVVSEERRKIIKSNFLWGERENYQKWLWQNRELWNCRRFASSSGSGTRGTRFEKFPRKDVKNWRKEMWRSKELKKKYKKLWLWLDRKRQGQVTGGDQLNRLAKWPGRPIRIKEEILLISGRMMMEAHCRRALWLIITVLIQGENNSHI